MLRLWKRIRWIDVSSRTENRKTHPTQFRMRRYECLSKVAPGRSREIKDGVCQTRGRVSPGDGEALGGDGSGRGRGMFWCSSPALLIFLARSARTSPLLYTYSKPGGSCWYCWMSCYFWWARPTSCAWKRYDWSTFGEKQFHCHFLIWLHHRLHFNSEKDFAL